MIVRADPTANLNDYEPYRAGLEPPPDGESEQPSRLATQNRGGGGRCLAVAS